MAPLGYGYNILEVLRAVAVEVLCEDSGRGAVAVFSIDTGIGVVIMGVSCGDFAEGDAALVSMGMATNTANRQAKRRSLGDDVRAEWVCRLEKVFIKTYLSGNTHPPRMRRQIYRNLRKECWTLKDAKADSVGRGCANKQGDVLPK